MKTEEVIRETESYKKYVKNVDKVAILLATIIEEYDVEILAGAIAQASAKGTFMIYSEFTTDPKLAMALMARALKEQSF